MASTADPQVGTRPALVTRECVNYGFAYESDRIDYLGGAQPWRLPGPHHDVDGVSSTLPVNLSNLLHGRGVESVRVEFKATWDPETTGPQVLKTICAFANDYHNLNGGYVVIGVAERDGRAGRPPVGLSPAELEAAQRWLRGNCNRLDPQYQPLLSPEVVRGRHILVVWAPASQIRPHRAPDGTRGPLRYWVRVGADTVDAERRGGPLRELIQQTARVPWDDRRALEAGLADLHEMAVREHLHEIGSGLTDEPDAVEVYRRMGITTRVNDHDVPRNVGLLFFAAEPTHWFRGAWIDCALFAAGGYRRRTGRARVSRWIDATDPQLPAVSVREVSGPRAQGTGTDRGKPLAGLSRGGAARDSGECSVSSQLRAGRAGADQGVSVPRTAWRSPAIRGRLRGWSRSTLRCAPPFPRCLPATAASASCSRNSDSPRRALPGCARWRPRWRPMAPLPRATTSTSTGPTSASPCRRIRSTPPCPRSGTPRSCERWEMRTRRTVSWSLPGNRTGLRGRWQRN